MPEAVTISHNDLSYESPEGLPLPEKILKKVDSPKKIAFLGKWLT